MSHKLSALELSLVSVFVNLAKTMAVAKSIPDTDPKLQLIKEAEACVTKLNAGFDPVVSNRLWNISKDPLLVNDSEFAKETNGAKCAISFIQSSTKKLVEDLSKQFISELISPIPTPAKSEYLVLTPEQEKMALELVGTSQIPTERKRRLVG